MDEWNALNGRVTLFPTGPLSPSSPSALDLYRRVWGKDPDSFQKQPNALLPTVAQGRGNGLTMQLLSQPARLDFNLSPIPIQGGPPSVALIDTPQLHGELMRIITVLEKGGISNSVGRLALGLQFIIVKADVVETNKTLIKVMPTQYRVELTDDKISFSRSIDRA
jgi:hypothetical protein